MRSIVAASIVVVATAVEGYNCPGSDSFAHAWMEVTSTADASCSDVHAEIVARASSSSWVDPHNGGVYSVLQDGQSVIQTQRTSNPATAVGGKLYVDKQTFELSSVSGGCQIKGCSESQSTSFSDFSTNYCDLRNLFCGSADGCQSVAHAFTVAEDSYTKSLGAGHDFSGCVVKSAVEVVEEEVKLETEAAVERYNCPGSDSFAHAWMEVTSTADASCSDVHAEIVARASSSSWVDPHNGGVYSVLQDGQNVIQTQRTSNPATAVGGKLYVDKQTFELSSVSGGCQIKGCSESQSTSFSDFSTNYCDLRNLFCGSADGCQSVAHAFTVAEDSYTKSLGAGHDFSGCVVKSAVEV